MGPLSGQCSINYIYIVIFKQVFQFWKTLNNICIFPTGVKLEGAELGLSKKHLRDFFLVHTFLEETAIWAKIWSHLGTTRSSDATKKKQVQQGNTGKYKDAKCRASTEMANKQSKLSPPQTHYTQGRKASIRAQADGARWTDMIINASTCCPVLDHVMLLPTRSTKSDNFKDLYADVKAVVQAEVKWSAIFKPEVSNGQKSQ